MARWPQAGSQKAVDIPPSSDLVRVQVDGLFDLFDHDIHFPRDWDFVILHGVNGVGKTKVLDLVKSALTENVGGLIRLPFRQARLTFEDGRSVEIVRSEGDRASDERHVKVEISFGKGQRRESYEVSQATAVFHPRIRMELERFTSLVPIDEDRFHDASTGEAISTIEAMRRYEDDLPDRLRGARGHTKAPPESLAMLCRSANVHLIETQRLLRASDDGRRRPTRRTDPAASVNGDAFLRGPR